MVNRRLLSMVSMLALSVSGGPEYDYVDAAPEPEPKPRPRLTTGTPVSYPPLTHPPTTAELSKARSMERKWRRAAAMYPGSPAAIALSSPA